ncbi:His-Xaa-Ser system radical SAM maturase HxsC [Agrobacterium rhizogenes]|uniref:4Fe-4S single cluster domain protein n=1 Tax=Rhizobium rhizogenes TaxID=359 RepID=A0A7S4ZS00_RHIRH|nr:His-Xaa-Ser system radical SAM maturase HxsC [Rhizobium rhizogenes]NTF52975.1 His-Xaa-Ser system radical SAM maturase HxsC [Rhizobium rhizogenes]NTH10185.1 His-Xaa-Ser system radical SAM maturase HxsC [Rhizobium rhizogenes]NTI06744.1 His-Xaa-Ser system radical SAM maturase HxsC [Rhizobium rhizogenes]NTI13549.1 His-Xaa-Ser system radical SAM maturase HxsC [Rhizobium rhizogenes]NTI91963.1 His-Xaa-Ser system radical SAM maturase HxsC [Rhizobium rhizogenes]
MIALRLKIDPLPLEAPIVVRLMGSPDDVETEHDAVLLEREGGRHEYDFNGFSLVVHAGPDESLDRDVLLILPGQSSAHRLIRASSQHNTLLVTEQCDQLCVMCSQPPKKYHTDLFEQFALAISLAPAQATIGISGGEPLLHKERLFAMLEYVTENRPDIGFHILSNGQHFEPSDMVRLTRLGTQRILWGIPLYSATPAVHDRIVGKEGAFALLEGGLTILMRAGASVELRTVAMRQNAECLEGLADYIGTRLGFISVWAIMQLERIGFGKMNWNASFLDSSVEFAGIAQALDMMAVRGIEVALYNFPLCSVPQSYQRLALSTISDWKRKYLDFCSNCGARTACGGFFEWYNHTDGFSALGPI